jgi:Tfp pilus assembly protein PilN
VVFEINLLPEKYRKKKLAIHVDAPLVLTIVGLALVVFIGLTTLGQIRQIKQLEEEKLTLDVEKIRVEQIAIQVRTYKRQIVDIRNKIETLQALGRRNGIQLQILQIVSAQLPDNLWLLDINEEPPRQQRAGTAQIRADQVLNLRGIALRKEGVTELITRLQSEDLIQRVQTNYLRPARVENTDIFEFSLTAVMNVQG